MRTRNGFVLPLTLGSQAVRAQLERVLGSAGFTRNERLSPFLRFVVERSLDGRDSERHGDKYPFSIEVYKVEAVTTPRNAGTSPKS